LQDQTNGIPANWSGSCDVRAKLADQRPAVGFALDDRILLVAAY
jgi:hypothetical protein